MKEEPERLRGSELDIQRLYELNMSPSSTNDGRSGLDTFTVTRHSLEFIAEEIWGFMKLREYQARLDELDHVPTKDYLVSSLAEVEQYINERRTQLENRRKETL